MPSISPPNTIKKFDLVSPYIHIPENINSFDFDTHSINEKFILKNIAGYIFRTVLRQINFEIDENFLSNFISLICDHYNSNHFHNFQHAVNVLHVSYLLLNETNLVNKLKPYIIFALLIAALSHDVDHPGNTNSYEINSLSKYAKIYNDISVLENHHCSLTFEILEFTGLLKPFKDEEFRDIRKTIISCILGTDMSKHGDCVSKLEGFDFENETFTIEEEIFISSCVIHFADLSNPIKNFDNSYEWSVRISQEYYEQAFKEETEGLPTLSFMKCNDKLSICINEISFITNISLPSWAIFVSKFKQLSFILDNISNTLIKWKELEKQYLSENGINKMFYLT
jgi:hypothetical protein